MNKNLKNLYDSLPVFFQNFLLSGYSAFLDRERYGSGFKKYRQTLDKSQWFTQGELNNFQDLYLRKLIQHAYETVPYYRGVFDRLRLKPGDIKTQADLVKLPLLRREDIKKNFKELISSKYRNKLKKGHTSGTTGSPLEICYCQDSINMTYAALDRHYKWAGCELSKRGDRIAVIRGNVIVPLTQQEPPFWRYNRTHNQILLSSFHLSSKNLDDYFEELSRFNPGVFDGYPSTLYILAKHLKTRGVKFPAKAVISSSETLYDFQRSLIEESFQCKVFDYYALAERVIFSSECDMHEGHHIYDEYGICEILDQDGKPCQKGQPGVLVGTSLHNMAMPLIRYATQDVTAIKDRQCSCGRNLQLMEDVTTKAEDILTMEDGRLISPSVLTHPFKPLNSIDASQIIQNDFNDITVKLVPNSTFSEAEREHLISELKLRLGQKVNIKIELADSLTRTASGKFRWVISNVKLGI